MKHEEQVPADQVTIKNLRALGKLQAPPQLLPGIMVRTGLGDFYTHLDSPVGLVFVAYNSLGISTVQQTANAVDFEQYFQARFGRKAYYVTDAPALLQEALDIQIHHGGSLKLDFDLRGLTEFEQKVLLKTSTIPRGELRSYSWIAREIAHPRAVRAVGTALGHNPIPLFIPCHRVIRSDGSFGQYSLGGAEMKRTILTAEGIDLPGLEQLTHSRARYIGSDTTHIYCFPTCHHARRISEQHRTTFRTPVDAERAGYRPCKSCRPTVVEDR